MLREELLLERFIFKNHANLHSLVQTTAFLFTFSLSVRTTAVDYSKDLQSNIVPLKWTKAADTVLVDVHSWKNPNAQSWKLIIFKMTLRENSQIPFRQTRLFASRWSLAST